MALKGYRYFVFNEIRSRWPDKACRYALSQVTGGRGVETQDAAEIRTAMTRVQRSWRARMKDLRKVGWGRIKSPGDYTFAVNCPPVAVYTNQTGLRPCRNYSICPFCWCREYVFRPYERFSRLLFEQTPAAMLDLIEVRTTRRYALDHNWTLLEPDGPFYWVGACRSNYIRRYLTDSLGSFMLCTVEPPDPRHRRPHYTLRHRVLSIVPSSHPDTPGDFEMERDVQIERVVNRTIQPDQQQLAGALGRTSLYPLQLLFGPAKETLEILKARSPERLSPNNIAGRKGKTREGGYRMSAYYGQLRQNRAGATLITRTERSDDSADDIDSQSAEDA